jgi:mannosyltransferase OCH1-like enzyme
VHYQHSIFVYAVLMFLIFSVQAWHHISFDTALQTALYPESLVRSHQVVGIEGHALYMHYKQLYKKYAPNVYPAHDELIIPKIIHQIWLGSPIPSVYKAYMNSWQKKHPTWEYRLWTDDNVHTLFPLYNQAFYDKTENYGTKSDILRWEILYRFGGLYVDVDYECLNSVDELHYRYDLYTGIQPLDAIFLQLGAALVGCRPKHPVLKHCIETIKDDWHRKGTPEKTGPVHFTRSFYLCAGKDTIDIALPPYYVYPLGVTQKPTQALYEQWINQGSYAIHWWSKSWMPKVYRPVRFRDIDNETSTATWND